MKGVLIVAITFINVMAQQNFSDGYKFTIRSGLLQLDTVKNKHVDTLCLKPVDTLKEKPKDTVRSGMDKLQKQ